MKVKTCKKCGKEFMNKNARDYCRDCGPTVKKELSRIREKKYDVKVGYKVKVEKYHQQRALARESTADFGATTYNDKHGHGIKVILPFTRDFSKNKILVFGGRIMKTKKANEAKSSLEKEVARMRHKFFQAKIWLDIVIYQPDHMGDALNYLDNFADAIQNAIGVNDRWYAIKNLNWHIDKNQPRIELWILQDATEHHAICQFCGLERPFKDFNEAAQRRLTAQVENGKGHAGQRICLPCKSLAKRPIEKRGRVEVVINNL